MRSRLLGFPFPIGGRATGMSLAVVLPVVEGRVGLGFGRVASGREGSAAGPADSASDLPTGFGFVAGAGEVDSPRDSAA